MKKCKVGIADKEGFRMTIRKLLLNLQRELAGEINLNVATRHQASNQSAISEDKFAGDPKSLLQHPCCSEMTQVMSEHKMTQVMSEPKTTQVMSEPKMTQVISEHLVFARLT